jgi:hypothetical protein
MLRTLADAAPPTLVINADLILPMAGGLLFAAIAILLAALAIARLLSWSRGHSTAAAAGIAASLLATALFLLADHQRPAPSPWALIPAGSLLACSLIWLAGAALRSAMAPAPFDPRD